MPSNFFVLSYDGVTANVVNSIGSSIPPNNALNKIVGGMSAALNVANLPGFENLKSETSRFVFEFGDNLAEAIAGATDQDLDSLGRGIIENIIKANSIPENPPVGNVISTFAANPAQKVLEVGGAQVSGGVVTEVFHQQFANNPAGLHDALLLPLRLDPACTEVSRVGIAYQEDGQPTVQTNIFSVVRDWNSDGYLVASRISNPPHGGNFLEGNVGFNTFYVPEVAGNTVVDDLDLRGRVAIGAGVDAVVLEGNATPVKVNGIIQPGEWRLNGLQLFKNGDDLLIGAIGVDLTYDTSSKVTIERFPWDHAVRYFGITLGQARTGELNSPETFTVAGLKGSIFASNDPRGRMFCAVKDGNNLSIKIFDAQGNLLLVQPLTNFQPITPNVDEHVSTDGQATILPNDNFAFIYATESRTNDAIGNFASGKSSAFLVITDPRGVVISNKMIDEGQVFNGAAQEPTYYRNIFAPSYVVVNADTKTNNLCFSRGGNQYFCAQFFSDGVVGETGTDDALFRGAVKLPLSEQDLPGGQRITVEGLNVLLFQPTLRDMRPDEIPNTIYVTVGANLETNTSNNGGIFSFEPGGKLKIKREPGLAFAIEGNATLELDADFNIRSYDDLEGRAGEFSFETVPNENLRRDQEEVRRTLEEAGYCQSTPGDLAKTLFSASGKYVVVNLPDNQKIIFPGMTMEKFLQMSPVIFPSIFQESTTEGPIYNGSTNPFDTTTRNIVPATSTTSPGTLFGSTSSMSIGTLSGIPSTSATTTSPGGNPNAAGLGVGNIVAIAVAAVAGLVGAALVVRRFFTGKNMKVDNIGLPDVEVELGNIGRRNTNFDGKSLDGDSYVGEGEDEDEQAVKETDLGEETEKKIQDYIADINEPPSIATNPDGAPVAQQSKKWK